MRRFVLVAALQIALGALWAQDKIVNTRVSALPCGRFFVDGQMYQGSAIFNWPEGSVHTLVSSQAYALFNNAMCVPVGTALDGTASCTDAWIAACSPDPPPCSKAPLAPCAVAGSWVDSNGHMVEGGGSVTITASSTISSYHQDWQYTYLVGIDIVQPDSSLPFSCDLGPDYGRLYVNGTCYAQSTSVWMAAGTTVTLQAFPPRGFVFTGWDGGPFQGMSSMNTSFVLNSSVRIHPRFEQGAPIYVRTNPAGLQVMADTGLIAEAGLPLYWARSSTHAISGVSPQMDLERNLWVWDSWDHGGAQTQIYKVPDSIGAVTLTANYAPGAAIKFLTVPFGLKLNIDGRTNWKTYDFVWKVGSVHHIIAPLENYDSAGRKYSFNAWSSGGDPEQDFTTPTATAQVLANYDILGRLRVESAPGPVDIGVDGAACHSPCLIDRRQGTKVKVSAPQTVAINDTMRLDFESFSDGGPRERTWTAGVDASSLTANYQASNRVQAVTDPPGGATFIFDPASPDGFYAANTDVTVTIVPKPGYKFKNWEMDATGSATRLRVNSSSPVYLRAMMDRVPFVAPTGVRNAAGETPEDAVAPGSIIAIYGGSLAPGYEKGPDSPLAQTIQTVTVQVADRILPLLFVSPEQINAQLPSDLPEGTYKLIVRGESQPDASSKFTVQRNAPGLFVNVVDEQQFAIAFHPNGNAVTTADPAQRGETIMLLGTGFGPYKEGSLDGLQVPSGLQFTLEDPAEILVGDQVVTPVSAIAAQGYVGLTAIRVRVGDQFLSGNVEIKARVNGHESNKVILPVQ